MSWWPSVLLQDVWYRVCHHYPEIFWSKKAKTGEISRVAKTFYSIVPIVSCVLYCNPFSLQNEVNDIPFFDIELPYELALKIFQYLNCMELGRCAQVRCRNNKNCVQLNGLAPSKEVFVFKLSIIGMKKSKLGKCRGRKFILPHNNYLIL